MFYRSKTSKVSILICGMFAYGLDTLSCYLLMTGGSVDYHVDFTAYISNHTYNGIGNFKESGLSLGTTGYNGAAEGIKEAINNATSYLELNGLPYIY